MNIEPNTTIITKTGIALYVGTGIAKGEQGIFFETVATLGFIPELSKFQDGDTPLYKNVPLKELFDYVNETCGGGIPYIVV